MMKISNPFKMFSLLLSAAYFLSACGGTLPQSSTSEKAADVQANMVVFTGIIEAMNGNQWTVSGQQVIVDPQISLNSNIKVGDSVKVDANVSVDGTVVARKVESPANVEIIPTPSADAGMRPDSSGTSTPDSSVTPHVSSTPDPSSPQIAGNDENELFGAVEALGVNTITVNGVTYVMANFTEIKDAIAVGDQVKLHVILNADGTLTVREVEKTEDQGDDNGNSNDSIDSSSNDDSDNTSNADSDHDANENDSGGGNDSDSGDG